MNTTPSSVPISFIFFIILYYFPLALELQRIYLHKLVVVVVVIIQIRDPSNKDCKQIG